MRHSLLILLCLCACNPKTEENVSTPKSETSISISETSLIILGNVQDGGSPHIGCQKDCCKALFKNPDKDRKVVSLGLIDVESQKKYLFEATPDMTEQMKMLKEACSFETSETPDGIFLTHAHIGHYAGLMFLGKEAMNASKAPVYGMPRMKNYLENNGPWSQLVALDNIAIKEITNQDTIDLSAALKVIPFTVPHRDEFSETVGYKIIGPNKSALFIPDIDKWEKWNESIIDQIALVDYAFVDATFFDAAEINNRDISEIPHPFIIESMELFKDLSEQEKAKVHFIHFNHTNPALDTESEQTKLILSNGFNIARIHDVITL
ncbi:MBL fold metallo-hydrolase [Fulvivirga lutimaris]|uniref:MBL fold metallo-hydrolase n=1 Tax=Fulvivirga lutimaris TaxID=1819566 RepID=UPI0012BD7956|nr:MBL fold metallo-hydrolase [Fulvivirga lutimaris]MTI41855.1 MBL fold metallo-hydrolase [Fulvivirga lutimaris]